MPTRSRLAASTALAGEGRTDAATTALARLQLRPGSRAACQATAAIRVNASLHRVNKEHVWANRPAPAGIHAERKLCFSSTVFCTAAAATQFARTCEWKAERIMRRAALVSGAPSAHNSSMLSIRCDGGSDKGHGREAVGVQEIWSVGFGLGAPHSPQKRSPERAACAQP